MLGTVAATATQAVLGDRADDSDAILAWVNGQGSVPVVSPRPTRTAARPTDWYWYWYEERPRIESPFANPENS